MQGQLTTLSYAVRIPVIVTYLSQLSLMVGLLTLFPLGMSLWYQEYSFTYAFLLVSGIFFGFGFTFRGLAKTDSLQPNEALVITALAFLVVSLLMSWPFMQANLTFMDAWFESVSAITTTGLTTLSTVSSMPNTFLFTRAWMQWYGGLGIVALSVALLFGQGMLIRPLKNSESPSTHLDTTTRTYARSILLAYASFTGLGIAVLWPWSPSFLASMAHVFSAISTGGFSTFDQNLAGFSHWAPRFILMILAFIGALTLPLYSRMYHKGAQQLWRDPEFRGLLIAGLLVSGLFYWISADLSPWPSQVGHALLVGFSAQTGTGFTTVAIDQLNPGAKALLLPFMMIGGSLGSTTGGIKIWRLIVLLQITRLMIHRTSITKHAVVQLRIGGEKISEEEILRVLCFITMFLILLLVSWIPFVVQNYPPLDALFDVMSAIATVGLSTGVVDISLPLNLKIILTIDMLLGRLEIFAFLVLVYPFTWWGNRKEES